MRMALMGTVLTAAGFTLVGATLTGCRLVGGGDGRGSGIGGWGDDTPVETVSAEAFASRAATERAVEPVTPGPAAAVGRGPDRAGVTLEPGSGAFGAEPVVVRGMRPAGAGGPQGAGESNGGPRAGRAAIDPGSMELLDAKVGDINGKPIYISSFFEPIEARLIAEAGRLNRNQWREVAIRDIIGPRLQNLIADELLRAEAFSRLTTQQRQGLRSFLTGFRRDLLTENLGSEQLARRRVETETGRTLDDTLREKENETLIQLSLLQQINRRVNVSWRDIQQRYERDIETYNPAPSARFRLIRLATENDEGVARVGERLANGEDFAAVASDEVNTFRADTGGLLEASFAGRFGEGEFFGAPALNERARTLLPGEATGPFELGGTTSWLKLEGIERTSVSLYEAQLRIEQELTLERRRAAYQSYIERLYERAPVNDREEMLIRLLRIAEARYGPGA
jgi:hypothetical protein